MPLQLLGNGSLSLLECDWLGMSESSQDEREEYEQGRNPQNKRRRLNTSFTNVAADDIESDISAEAPNSPVEHSPVKLFGRDEQEEKSKSKYRIHIPKNAGIPQDAFFTQLPQQPSSPYRIGHFCWQKPREPPSTVTTQTQHGLVEDRHVNKQTTPVLRNSEDVGPTRKQDQLASLCPPTPAGDENAEFSDSDLDDIQADALLEPILIDSQPENLSQQPQQRGRAPLANLRQTTLFGSQTAQNAVENAPKKRNWPLANREEPATHHRLDRDALETWVYPTNLGAIRDYQFSIVAKGLYHNMLVALPTGLGKTFIAATIMLNWYRWAPEAQIVFVAPTKPLVSQQVKACFDIAGIPRSSTSMLTGVTSPGIRAEEWRSKRIFFMTPQTIVNDLKTGICDPKKLVLLVVDEAHRATGAYAYVEAVKFIKRFNPSFRVLALTATPGSTIETVQEVIDGLGISRIEIRTEESLDIRQYVHARKIETVLFNNSEEIEMILDLFSKALKPLVEKLNSQNAYWSKDPLSLTPFGCTQARQRWMASDAGRKAHWGLKSMVMTIFSLLASLSHGIELLKYHSIGTFYHKLLSFRNDLHAGDRQNKYAKQVNESDDFQKLMSRVQIWINTPDFIGHPKLEYLQQVVLNHFLDAGEGLGASDPSSTRIMVFSHYRDSAEEIVRILSQKQPMIRPHVFVGQAVSGKSGGMDQKKQLEILDKFKSGVFNTLVATSIGEEGLDIGEVDLIVCYDASASPIRMLQRMGRTGRKRAGNIVVTLMRGKEENNFTKAKDNYQKMQAEIASGARFNFHDEESKRIVPKEIQPVVDKKCIEIPVENTQAELPEPKRRGKPPKRPPKKFHMPDGVRSGFVKASRMDNSSGDEGHRDKERLGRARNLEQAPEAAVDIPALDQVLLTSKEEKAFEKRYLDIGTTESQIIDCPRMDAFPELQRKLRPTKTIGHGRRTFRTVEMLNAMSRSNDQPFDKYESLLADGDRDAAVLQKKRRRADAQQKVGLMTSTNDRDALYDRSLSDEPVPNREMRISDPAPDVLNNLVLTKNLDDAHEQEVSASENVSSSSTAVAAEGRDVMSRPESEGELPDFETLLGIGKQNSEPPRILKRPQKRVVCEDSEDDSE